MGSIPNEFSISLRAWPSKENNPNALSSLIQRIKSERGSFRDISEESLRQEIAEAEAGTNAANDKAVSNSEDAEADKPDRTKELVAARDEILAQIEQAHMSSLYALDFVSLLLSKDTPVQAGLSISQVLRETVGMGTLGADKVQSSRVTDAQKQENKRVAKGWKIQNLNKAVDSILASATRLEKEIELETKYWEQVLAVSENGWAICRLPQEKHTLGVRFGFAEAAPAFRNRSLAALRRNADGSISLDQGISSSLPQRLRVRIETNGSITGECSLPNAVPEDAPIEALILQARNTIFSEELWQELNREARTLASYGVRAKADTITCPLTAAKTISVDLVPLGDVSTPLLGDDSPAAEALSLALQLLQSYAHRQNYRRRTLPPPPLSSQKRPNPPYALLRPLLTCLKHQNTVTSLHNLLVPLCSVLVSTAISPPPSYTILSSPPSAASVAGLSTAETTILSLVDRLEAVTSFKITEDTMIVLKSRTSMFPIAGTLHYLSLEPANCPLNDTCKAPPNLGDIRGVKEYVLFAMGCALAAAFAQQSTAQDVNRVADGSGEDDDGFVDEYLIETGTGKPGRQGWYQTSQPNVLRKTFKGTGRSKQMSFVVVDGERKGESVKLRLSWEWMSDSFHMGKAERRLGVGEGMYEWKGGIGAGWGDSEGEVVRALSDVIEEAGKWRD